MPSTEQLSRNRLFTAGRKLFAGSGYESTSTSSIAREAGTSESQLIKHFGGKAGLLNAIFTDAWMALKPQFESVLRPIESPSDRLRMIPRLLMDALGKDPDLRVLLLLEGRRIRKEGMQSNLMDGFRGLVEQIDQTLSEMSEKGQLRELVSPGAVRAAILGITEGAMRDQLLAERAGRTPGFTAENIGTLTDALVNAVTTQGQTDAANQSRF
jgi:AcrR family transcriptional regulator